MCHAYGYKNNIKFNENMCHLPSMLYIKFLVIQFQRLNANAIKR
jgi:hypothetical protein